MWVTSLSSASAACFSGGFAHSRTPACTTIHQVTGRPGLQGARQVCRVRARRPAAAHEAAAGVRLRGCIRHPGQRWAVGCAERRGRGALRKAHAAGGSIEGFALLARVDGNTRSFFFSSGLAWWVNTCSSDCNNPLHLSSSPPQEFKTANGGKPNGDVEAKAAAEALLEESLRRGTADNVTCVVMLFAWG
jgi:hypothetical protein